MRALKLYGPAIILAVWAALWWTGFRTDRLIGFMLGILAVATFIEIRESIRRRRER